MIWLAMALALVGLFLSAFFSGSETGFYRVSRMRLVLDALGGHWVARALLWLSNHPSMFVATTLVGNNLANCLTSLAVVMGIQAMVGGEGNLLAELLAPILLAPFLFVYGELLPKNLFLNAPNRMLKVGGPLFLLFVPLFLPVSFLLWGFNQLLSRLVAASPERVRVTIARRELRRALEEGHEVGIVRPSQVRLARGVFAVANERVIDYATPLGEIARARVGMTGNEVLRLARRLRIPDVPVEATQNPLRLAGYVRVIEQSLNRSGELGPVRPLLEISSETTHIEALMRMHDAQENLAAVVDAQGNTLGLLTATRLRESLVRGGRKLPAHL